MLWSHDLPKVTGWYWFRPPKPSLDGLREIIVFVETTDGKSLFRDGRNPGRVEAWPGMWAGPIPEPTLFKYQAEEDSSTQL